MAIIQKTAYLVGDSEIAGKDQVISDTLFFKITGFGEKRKYDGLDNTRNVTALKNAEKTAKEGNFHNVRLVVVTKAAKTIKMGVVRWIEKRREVKPFAF
jgi:hypothetical protein